MEFEIINKIYFDVERLADRILDGDGFLGALEAEDVERDYREFLSIDQQWELKIAVFEEVVKQLKKG